MEYHFKNSAWGSLHVILEDNNLEDHHILFTIDYAKKCGDMEGEFLATQLLLMDMKQRKWIAENEYTDFALGYELELAMVK